MVDANSLYGGNYLKITDVAKPQTYTIKAAAIENVGDKTKLVLSFNETDKTFVVNKTNARRISDKLGSAETDSWVGKKITLMKDYTQYQGTEVECIRVKRSDE